MHRKELEESFSIESSYQIRKQRFAYHHLMLLNVSLNVHL